MLSLSTETKKEIHAIITNRISKAPTFIKNAFEFEYRNQKIVIEEYDYTLFVGLLSPKEIKSLKWRQKKNVTNFPYLIAKGDEPALLSFSNSNNSMLSKVTIEGACAFQIGENTSIIVENFTIDIPATRVGQIKYTIDLGFIVRSSNEDNLYSLTEILDDLIVYYIKNKREAAHDLAI